MIERQITIGLITSTDFIQRIKDRCDVALLEGPYSKRVAAWCLEYFETYNKAPGKAIQTIFAEKSTQLSKVNKDLVDIIEDFLESISDEFEKESINVDYLVDKSIVYFNEKYINRFTDEIQGLLHEGKIDEAELKAASFKPIVKDSGTWVELSSEKIKDVIHAAFTDRAEPLITYPGALGEFLNDVMVRGGFVAFMSIREKIGKTYQLIEYAMKASKKRLNVAFFSAGDMSNKDIVMRIAVYLARKSNQKKYCGEMFEPVVDCVMNQNDTCRKKERACDFGVFEGKTEEYLRTEVTQEELLEAFEDNEDYTPCTNCELFKQKPLGCTWVKKVDVGENPLTEEETIELYNAFFAKYSRRFKAASFPSGTLTVKQIESTLDLLEKEEGFVPDIILLDYPDIMDEESTKDFRQKQNIIWMKLRGVSQARNALLIIVTQGDSDAYEQDLLKMKNFSEDKRKYAHPTAFIGINQDKRDREKAIGIIRLNMLVKREGDFISSKVVHVLQNLKRGRPFIGSYW